MMLQQLPTQEVLETSRRRPPGDFLPWGTWGQIRRSPDRLPPRRKDGCRLLPMDALGDSMPKGHCLRMGPVTQSHQVEALGDLCWREHTIANRREPKPWWQSRWGLLVAPANVADWGGTTQRSQLVETKGRGWDHPGWGSLVSPTIEAPPPGTPGCRRALPAGCWGVIWTATPADVNTWRSRALPLHLLDLVVWHARYVQMPPCWEKLTMIPGHEDYKEFTWKVHTSFEMPKACNSVKRVDNYHILPPALPSTVKHCFLLPKNVGFRSQHICLTQVQYTIAYMSPAMLGRGGAMPSPQPTLSVGREHARAGGNGPTCYICRGGCLCHHGPSGWMEITLPQSMKAKQPEPLRSHSHSHSQSSWACPRGALLAAYSESWSTATAMWATAKTEAPTTQSWEMMPLQFLSDYKPPCPSPGFMEIAQALLGGRTCGKWPAIGCHQHSTWGSHRPIKGHGVSHDGNPSALTPHHGGIIQTHSLVHWGLWAWGLTPWQMTTWP